MGLQAGPLQLGGSAWNLSLHFCSVKKVESGLKQEHSFSSTCSRETVALKVAQGPQQQPCMSSQDV